MSHKKKLFKTLGLTITSFSFIQAMIIEHKDNTVSKELTTLYSHHNNYDLNHSKCLTIEENYKPIKINKKNLFIPKQLGNISLHHDNNEFTIKHNSKTTPIQRCFMDKELRGISKDQLVKILATGAYLSVNKMEENTYSLKLNARLNGGGAGGAVVGFYVGRFLTHFVAHGTILIVSACTGPAAPATFAALEATFLPHIAVAAEAGALAGGMIGAVATGPV